MAIGAIHLVWMRHLAGRGCFRGLKSVIDLGPQDIQLDRRMLRDVMQGLTPSERLDELLDQVFSGNAVASYAQIPFYSLFGLGPYASIDVEDKRATYRVDLNQPVTGLPEFDVVTNYGTTEHVFNIGEAFRTIHNLTRPGGVSLHCVPSFAFINHGFYGINPNALIEMIRANDYDLIDFSYCDNAFVRNVRLGNHGLDSFNLESLPVTLADMENTQTFMTKVVDLYHRNLLEAETREAISAVDPATRNLPPETYPSAKHHICFVFDLIFVAMRRPPERLPFVMPIQNASGVPPLVKAKADTPAAPAPAESRWRGRVKRWLSSARS